ncbi:hypothetical protein SDC9_150179 [bioreactor metagenome]|uniref:Uncharacterized protein n=1 Tax=bioreactor metagenome TaxID=1076179 RepID=A0A645ELS2_9ZZZZ
MGAAAVVKIERLAGLRENRAVGMAGDYRLFFFYRPIRELFFNHFFHLVIFGGAERVVDS